MIQYLIEIVSSTLPLMEKKEKEMWINEDHGGSLLERMIWEKSKQNCFVGKGYVGQLTKEIAFKVNDNGMRNLYKERQKIERGLRTTDLLIGWLH